MMVYLVMQDVPYDTCDVVAVYAEKHEAEKRVSALKLESPQWNYFVEEHELIGA